MKTFITILCSIFLLIEGRVCAQTTGSYTSHLQTERGTYTWDIGSDRLYATPEWTSETNAIPLSFDKACQLGRDWLTKHDLRRYGLDEARLLSFPAVNIAAMSHGKAKRRFYYWIMYRSEAFDAGFMYVYVLMDGTVVEPTLTPLPAKKP